MAITCTARHSLKVNIFLDFWTEADDELQHTYREIFETPYPDFQTVLKLYPSMVSRSQTLHRLIARRFQEVGIIDTAIILPLSPAEALETNGRLGS